MERATATQFIHELLQLLVAQNGSDLFITADFPPALKIDGKISPVSKNVLTPQHTIELVRSVMNDKQASEFEATKECNFAISPPGVGRFRVNAFVQQGRVGMVLRTILTTIPKFEDLNLPPVLKEVAMSKRGIMMFIGPTGCGKSTSMAALLGYRNENSYGHIITIEDPIEFVHPCRCSLITQRQVGTHTGGFATALRAALREDPDVIVVGEMHDRETAQLAVTAAETGHLVFATLHTQDAPQTIDRIIDVFPPHQQEQIRVQLSTTLMGVCTQQLLPTRDGRSRVVACEILVPTPAVRNLIREGKTHQIYSTMQTGTQFGMQTMDAALADLVRRNIITRDLAKNRSSDPGGLERLLTQPVGGKPVGAAAGR